MTVGIYELSVSSLLALKIHFLPRPREIRARYSRHSTTRTVWARIYPYRWRIWKRQQEWSVTGHQALEQVTYAFRKSPRGRLWRRIKREGVMCRCGDEQDAQTGRALGLGDTGTETAGMEGRAAGPNEAWLPPASLTLTPGLSDFVLQEIINCYLFWKRLPAGPAHSEWEPCALMG